MRVQIIWRLVLVVCVHAISGSVARADFTQPEAKRFPDLFVWQDTCNVYVLREGKSALLIELGDGTEFDVLRDIGGERVERVLLTTHHRENCQRPPKVKGAGAKTAAPEDEQSLFEK